MVDVTLCDGNDCSIRDRCLRYLLLPRANELWQSYLSSKECIAKDNICFMTYDK